MINQQQKQYPVPYFKDLHRPRWATSRKEEDELQADFWQDDQHRIPPQRYPKALYRVRDGALITVGNYDKEGKVDLDRAIADEARLLGDGSHVLEPVQKPVAAEKTVVSTGGAGTRLDALEERMDKIDGALSDIMQMLRQGQKRGKLVNSD